MLLAVLGWGTRGKIIVVKITACANGESTPKSHDTLEDSPEGIFFIWEGREWAVCPGFWSQVGCRSPDYWAEALQDLRILFPGPKSSSECATGSCVILDKSLSLSELQYLFLSSGFN